MSVNNIVGGELYAPMIAKALKLGVNIQTLGAQKVLDADDAPLQVLNHGGVTRNVLLPPEERGLTFVMINNGTGLFDLSVRDDTGVTVIGTVSENEAALFVCDGVAWHALVGANT